MQNGHSTHLDVPSSKLAGRRAPALDGLSILVVEDETIVSFLIEDMLAEHGCADIRHAAAIGGALALIDERVPDAAVLDVNLAGLPVFPVAERLAALRVPFIFATGYGRRGIPDQWSGRPVVQKPFHVDVLIRTLFAALDR